MRIGIDARFYGPMGKGLGRYTQKLIENLEKIDSDNDYFIFLRSANFEEYNPQNEKFKKVLANYRWYSFGEQFLFPQLLKKYKLDLVHFPHFNVPIFYFGKFVVTIHDLILLHFPTIRNTTLNPLFYWIKFLAYRLVINLALRRADSIITVSNFTKTDILENYKFVSSERVEVTYEACDDFCRIKNVESEENILKNYGIIKPYLLYIGNAYPHKNLERLLDCFCEIGKGKNIFLVLVGGEDYFYKRLKKTAADKKIKNIIFSGYVPDCDLDIVIKNCVLYVWPSLYEGFGLSPLEAMAKGIPVVSADHPCMREILGESAVYFDGKSVSDMAKTIKETIDNKDLKIKMADSGYEQIKKYSWIKMAKETLAIYKKA